MPEIPLPDFKPRQLMDDVTITIPAWMACMFMAETRDINRGAIDYVTNQFKKELYTQRTINEQEALLEQHQEIHQMGLQFIRQQMGGTEDDPRIPE